MTDVPDENVARAMERIGGIPLSDAHVHLPIGDAAVELASRLERNIFTCFSTGTPEEWARAKRLLMEAAPEGEPKPFSVSFGIHPWEAAVHEPRATREAYEQCAAVGEIGLDTVWCDVPLARQSAVFEEQLQIAADLHKPIVLHTKGAESRIADMVRGFPAAVLVHWYSGPVDGFERFTEQGCYFTLGPDCGEGSELGHAMMTALPLERILVETDGVEGIQWAIEQSPSLAKHISGFHAQGYSLIEAALLVSTNALARARRTAPFDVALRLQENMKGFYVIR